MVNVVVFGFIDIDMIKVLSDEQCEVIFKDILVNCLGQLEEVVVMVVFLVSDGVVYIFGEIIYVNGGMYMG